MPAASWNIGKKRLNAYEVLGWTGIFLSFAVGVFCLDDSPADAVFLLILYASGLVGAYAWHVLKHLVTDRPSNTLYHYFLLLGAICVAVAYLEDRKVVNALDLFAVCFSVIACFGRIGCFHAGCCHGRPARFGTRYGSDYISRGLSVFMVDRPLFPTQLLESALHLLNAVAGVVLVKSQAPAGLAFVLLTTVYAIFRFLIEFARGDRRPYFRRLSEAQWTAVVLLAGCIAAFPAVLDQRKQPIVQLTAIR